MRHGAVTRITADICMLFTVCCFFFSRRMFLYNRGLGVLAAFAAASFAATFLAVRFPHPVLRVLFGLLPALALWKAHSTALLVVLIIAEFYLFVSLAAGRFEMDLSLYRRIYVLCAVLCVLFGIFSLAGFALAPGVLPFGTAYLLLGLLSLRRIRTGARMEARWEAVNALGVLIPVAGATGLCAGISVLLKHGQRFWEILLVPLGSIFYFLSQIGVWISNGFLRMRTDSKPLEHADIKIPGDDSVLELPPEEGLPETDYFQFHVNWRTIGFIGLILLAIIVVWLIIRYIRLSRPDSGESSLYEETSPFLLRRKNSRHAAAGASRRGGASRVRKLYRTYLNHLRVRGMAIRRHHTTRDIVSASEQGVLSPDEERLREIYLIARYGGDERISEDELREAEALLEKIRSASRQDAVSAAGKGQV